LVVRLDGAADWSVCFVGGVGVIGRPTLSFGFSPIIFDSVRRKDGRDVGGDLALDGCELFNSGPASTFSTSNTADKQWNTSLIAFDSSSNHSNSKLNDLFSLSLVLFFLPKLTISISHNTK